MQPPIYPADGQVQKIALMRILDANSNRALEGLRTIEEIARFHLNSSTLQGELKQLRHALVAALAELDPVELARSRHTAGDVGTETTTESEQTRFSISDVLAAATQRTQQALRCLEEFSKPHSKTLALTLQSIRYQAYDLFARITRTEPGKVPWQLAQLYVLVDASRDPESFGALVHGIGSAGADVIQLRTKTSCDAKVHQYAKIAVDACRHLPTRVIVNDRPDIALLVGADGVHVGQEDLSIHEVRKIAGHHLQVGVSTHNLQQALQAQADGADYVGCGPTFPSSTKAFPQFTGLEFLQEVVQHITVPAFAIGGIATTNIDQVLATGFRRVALSGAIDRAQFPVEATRFFVSKLRNIGESRNAESSADASQVAAVTSAEVTLSAPAPPGE